MDTCSLPVAISVAACTIAAQIENTDQLTLLGATLAQLGDTLSTIAAQRALCQGDDTTAPITE